MAICFWSVKVTVRFSCIFTNRYHPKASVIILGDWEGNWNDWLRGLSGLSTDIEDLWEWTRGWQCQLKVWSNAIQVNRNITLYKFLLKMLSLHLLKRAYFLILEENCYRWKNPFVCVMLIWKGRLICLSDCLYIKMIFYFSNIFSGTKFYLILGKAFNPLMSWS